jgi:DNA-binding SARP family transcriptional activator
MAPKLVLRLLGPPRAESRASDVVRPIPPSKNLALLAYLALEPGPHPRTSVAALLWGESTDRAAATSLRQALSKLRGPLGDALVVGRTTVELTGPLECDVLEFLRAVADDPTRATRFDVPQFLEGFLPRHAPEFESWAAATRRRLLELYAEVLRRLARDALSESEWAQAIGWADRWRAIDPLNEEATRIGVEAVCLAGRRSDALRRYREYRDLLARQLHVEPGVELTRLIKRITAAAEASHNAAGGTEPRFESRLVGRAAEWRELVRTWEAAQSGSGRLIVLAGEAGVGKTRLADQFLRWVSLEGAVVLRGRGYDPQAGVPYAPVADALRGVLDAPGLAATAAEWLGEAARLFPELRSRFPHIDHPEIPEDRSTQWRLFEGIAQIVLNVAAEQPALVFVDDLHYCDDDSCTLLHFLAQRFVDAPITLCGSVTTGLLERDTPAKRLLSTWRARSDTTVLDLAPLCEVDVWEMIRDMGRLRTPGAGRRFAARVYEVTDGNPFHVVELLKTLFEQGLLRADPKTGEWLASRELPSDGYDALQLPRTVRDAIHERVTRLPYELRDLLASVAVSGRALAIDVLSHVHGISRLRTAALADGLVERRLLGDEGGRYRAAHPVIADVVRTELTAARRAELHRAIALALHRLVAEQTERGAVAGEIARHAERGGERQLAYTYALIASEDAIRRYAFEEARSWLDLAASTATDAEREEVDRREAQLVEVAGWLELPAAGRVGTPSKGIRRSDLDLGMPQRNTTA